MTVRRRRGHGPECPECGGTLTPVTLSGKDTRGRPLRKRRCEECNTTFATIESIITVYLRDSGESRLAKFSEVDDVHRDRVSAAKRHKFGWAKKGRQARPHDISGGAFITVRAGRNEVHAA